MEIPRPRRLALALLAATAAAPAVAGALGAGAEEFVREPVLVVEESGSGDPASSALLVVYSDGRTVYATSGIDVFGLPAEVRAATVPLEAVHALAHDLVDLGALQATDLVGNEIAVATVTLLRAGTDGPQHSFSYAKFPFPQYLQIDNAIQTFLDEVFLPLTL